MQQKNIVNNNKYAKKPRDKLLIVLADKKRFGQYSSGNPNRQPKSIELVIFNFVIF
jgi:hypothetical protein